jgi:uncharacterized protein YkwD
MFEPSSNNANGFRTDSRQFSVSLRDMPRPVRTVLTLLLCVAALALSSPAQADSSRMEVRLVARINDARAAHGLHALRVASTLQRGAHGWARHLLRSDSFHHDRLTSGTGEILAWGTCSWMKPAKAVRMWLDSAPHRELLLEPSFRKVGTGWLRGQWRAYGCAEMAVARFR